MQSHTSPFVTIGITAWNEGDWLREAWQSVLDQDDNGWNAFMVLDGGATSKSEQVFNSIVHERLTKIKLEKNVGPYPARTLAIQGAKTPWFYGLDADDRLPKNTLSLMRKTIEAYPEADFLFGDVLHYTENWSKLYIYPVFDIEHVATGGMINGQSPYTVELFNRVGGFCQELAGGGADLDYWIGVYGVGGKGVRIEGTIYERRRRTQNVGTRTATQVVQKIETIISRHQLFVDRPDIKNGLLKMAYEKAALSLRNLPTRMQASEYALKALELGSLDYRMTGIIKESTSIKVFYLLQHYLRKIMAQVIIL